MLLESLVTPKKDLTIVTESLTLAEALEILEASNNRCVPILDEDHQLFRGNIYRMHIYRHLASHGDMHLPVTYLLKNATKFIYSDSSYFNLFFSMRDLPYIAVLNEQKEFLGILSHEKMLNACYDRIGLDNSSYTLTIETNGKQTDLTMITKIVSKVSPILNCLTLNLVPSETKQEILITLPETVDEETKNKIIYRLERKKFHVTRVDSRLPEPREFEYESKSY